MTVVMWWVIGQTENSPAVAVWPSLGIVGVAAAFAFKVLLSQGARWRAIADERAASEARKDARITALEAALDAANRANVVMQAELQRLRKGEA